MKVVLENKDTVEIGKIKVRHVPKLARFVNKIVGSVPDWKDKFLQLQTISEEQNDTIAADVGITMFTEWLPTIIEQAWDEFIEAVAEICDASEEDVGNMELDSDIIKIIEAFFQQNSFGEIAEKLKNAVRRPAEAA